MLFTWQIWGNIGVSEVKLIDCILILAGKIKPICLC